MLSLLACYLPYLGLAAALPNQTTFWSGLTTALSNSGLTDFLNAVAIANTTTDGQALVTSLYSNSSFTIYAPVNAAWVNLTNPPANEDLVSLLSYHIISAQLNSSNVAPSREHTIAFTKLRTPTILLPGNQTQILVLETAENVTAGATGNKTTILIRGDHWNATSVGGMITYQNLLIQPIDEILAIPSPLLNTMSSSGLALAANLGATSYVDAVSSLGLNTTVAACVGCTFFVPVNAAFSSSNLSSYNISGQTGVLENHIVSGTVLYSPLLVNGATFTTSRGEPLVYSSNSTGDYVSCGKSIAQLLRSDIPVSNGVAHLIDTVLLNDAFNAGAASSAASAASAAATGSQGGIAGTMGFITKTASATATDAVPATTVTLKSGSIEVRVDGMDVAKSAVLVALGALFWL